mgnify:CR=1 FL=1
MAKKVDATTDTLLLGKEIEWMKKEINEIKAWQDKLLEKIEDFEDKFSKSLNTMIEENDKKYARKEDVDVLKKARIRFVALVVWWVITTILAKIWIW